MYLALRNVKMTVKYLKITLLQTFVHEHLKLLDFLPDFVLIFFARVTIASTDLATSVFFSSYTAFCTCFSGCFVTSLSAEAISELLVIQIPPISWLSIN